MTKICTIPGCEKKHNARGWCSTHYNNWKRRGDPLQFADPKVTKKKQSESAKKRIKRDGFSPGMQRKGEPGLQKGKKYGPSPLKNRKLGPKSEETRKKISKSKTGKSPNFSDEDKKRRKERWTGEKNPNFGGMPPEQRKQLSEIKKKAVAEGTYTSPMKGKKHTDAAKKKNADKHRHPADPKTKALLVKQRNTTKGKENAKKGWHAMRKNIGRPNIPEKAIGEILSGIGIKCKFLQNVHYTTIDNKSDSKEMDVVWKDSMGNKKIIEYNGRYHFDSREHKPDEYVIVHNESRKCQDIWDEENMILNQIRKEGYEILVVWQLDWKKERDQTIKKILKFANSKSLS